MHYKHNTISLLTGHMCRPEPVDVTCTRTCCYVVVGYHDDAGIYINSALVDTNEMLSSIESMMLL